MLGRTVPLPAAGPCLRTRPAISSAPSAAVAAAAAAASKAPRILRFSSMSIVTTTAEPTLRLAARTVRRGPLPRTFSTIGPAPATAMSEVQGPASEDTAAALADISPTLSPSSATSTSSTARKPSSNPKPHSQLQCPETNIATPTDELTDSLYTERAKLLLSKRSLIEGAARVDHERETASTSSPPSTYTMPLDEISLMLNRSVPERPDDQLDEKAKNSLAHHAGKAIRNKSLCGVVVSAGKMDQTVTVRFPRRDWSRKVKRHYTKPFNRLVHDPANAVRAGDVISITLPPQGAHQHMGDHVFHVVDKIVVPFGVPLEERPPVMSMVDLALKWRAKTQARLERRRLRREATERGEVVLTEPTAKVMKRSGKMRGKTNRELKEEGGMKELMEKEEASREKKSKWKEFRELKKVEGVKSPKVQKNAEGIAEQQGNVAA